MVEACLAQRGDETTRTNKSGRRERSALRGDETAAFAASSGVVASAPCGSAPSPLAPSPSKGRGGAFLAATIRGGRAEGSPLSALRFHAACLPSATRGGRPIPPLLVGGVRGGIAEGSPRRLKGRSKQRLLGGGRQRRQGRRLSAFCLQPT